MTATDPDGSGRSGCIVPLDADYDAVDSEHLWGFVNEPPSLSLHAWPRLHEQVVQSFSDIFSRFFVIPYLRPEGELHIYPNAELFCSTRITWGPGGKIVLKSDMLNDGKDGAKSMYLRALRPIAQGEEIYFGYGNRFYREYRPSMVVTRMDYQMKQRLLNACVAKCRQGRLRRGE
eukprot:gnl/TRDRNA2_/TRDRNA2_72917_c0_seq1.p1 gnl/TRDRNA2_/TRDRNA2_72917_c0~~gnl/TRDRNA2_/TRDRNA2_72917_c0_seq1.p1  ORF type:complete len:196 (+),score=25.64 gnl/TRDRNA2_/TRDRNA2_72917_c0_seq1:66-590(+)